MPLSSLSVPVLVILYPITITIVMIVIVNKFVPLKTRYAVDCWSGHSIAVAQCDRVYI